MLAFVSPQAKFWEGGMHPLHPPYNRHPCPWQLLKQVTIFLTRFR